jgi:hypothetical protein
MKKEPRGRLGMYMPPLLEALGLAEVEHLPRNNRTRAKQPLARVPQAHDVAVGVLHPGDQQAATDMPHVLLGLRAGRVAIRSQFPLARYANGYTQRST